MNGRDAKLAGILILFIALLFGSGCSLLTGPEDEDDCETVVYKPNIYLYPDIESAISVKLNFPNGGYITISDPDYGDGWNVNVKPNGLIDDEHTYLFYECKIPNLCQLEEGWVVDHDSLSSFFSSELESLLFREQEIADFIEYWIPILIENDTYAIYPQYSGDIEQMVTIECDISPNSMNRVWYYVREYSEDEDSLSLPSPKTFERNGFHIMEWGVIL